MQGVRRTPSDSQHLIFRRIRVSRQLHTVNTRHPAADRYRVFPIDKRDQRLLIVHQQFGLLISAKPSLSAVDYTDQTVYN